MVEIPKFTSLSITQNRRPPSIQAIGTLDHLLVIAPERGDTKMFRRLPFGSMLTRLMTRARKQPTRSLSTRADNPRCTGITLALASSEEHGSFERLTWARKTLAQCVLTDRGKLGVLIIGFAEAIREQIALTIVAAAEAAAFELPSFRSQKRPAQPRVRSLVLFPGERRLDLRVTRAAAHGNNLARWLTAMPPNLLAAAKFRAVIEAAVDEHGFAHEFYDEAELARRGAGAFLAVSQGNHERDAGVLHLSYEPERTAGGRLALVGKGIVFDTGGNNLKPFKSMLDMHIDMQGAAVALGTLVAFSLLEAEFAVDCWLAITENRVSARAYKSQDVVTASNGTTIQVIHTDAEGRMVLADTLAIAAKAGPDLIIDYATLTGACVTALTERYSGVFSNRQAANEALLAAGRSSGERVWPFPMDGDFDEALESPVADIKQCATEGAGDHILAARFLSRFVPKSIPWIHVDLSSAQHKGGLAHIPTEYTGFGVRLSLELLRRELAGGEGLQRLFRQ